MFSYVDGFVCVFVCVSVCVVVCLKLEIIVFGRLLPEFCIVVSLNQPICTCVECPSLKPVTVSVLPVDDLTVLFYFCPPLYPILSLTILLFLFPTTFFSFSHVHIFHFSIYSSPYHIHFYLSSSDFPIFYCALCTHLLLPNSPRFNTPVTF